MLIMLFKSNFNHLNTETHVNWKEKGWVLYLQPYFQRLRLRAAFFWSKNLTSATLNFGVGT
jgi:hypothetical protein